MLIVSKRKSPALTVGTESDLLCSAMHQSLAVGVGVCVDLSAERDHSRGRNEIVLGQGPE